MCCFAVTQFLILGKSIISNASKVQDQEIGEEMVKIDWPEDSVERAKIIRTKAQSMTGSMEAVFNSFITGKILDFFTLVIVGYFTSVEVETLNNSVLVKSCACATLITLFA